MSKAVVEHLVQFGFTPVEAKGLHAAWKNPNMQYLLTEVAFAVHDAGGTAADALDFVRHGLPVSDAGFYQHHGFTAHQAHVIEHGPGHDNLFGEGTLGALDILELAAPRHYVTLALSVAHGDQEAKDLIRRYESVLAGRPRHDDDDEPDTTRSLEELLATMGADPSATHCDCSFDTE
jgi:hypothetical protein